jgi:predicted P-loop ATPase
VLLVCDEFENFYNKGNDSLFKSLVTADVVDYVPIYEKTMKKEDRNAVIVGTTNKRSLPFEQDSNRRLALVDVKWIDTDAMRKINWHNFYRHYVAEGKKAIINGLHPWKLTPEIIKLQYLENEAFRSQSNKEIILREVFDFDMEIHKEIPKYDMPGIQNNPQLYKMKDITGTLKQHYPEVYFAPAEMKHLLKRLCGKYTHTTNKEIPLSNAIGHIKDGIIKQGQYIRYVMPPLLTDFS